MQPKRQRENKNAEVMSILGKPNFGKHRRVSKLYTASASIDYKLT